MMFKHTTELVRLANGNRARVELRFSKQDATERETTAHGVIWNPLRVSFMGDEIGHHCNPALDGSIWGCGQIQDIIRGAMPRVFAAWERWHLNDMRSHCVHQDASQPWDTVPPCPETGYRCGSSWLVEPLTVAGAIECLQAVGARATVIGRDGIALDVIGPDGNVLDAMHKLQGQSVSYAIQYGGYSVTEVTPDSTHVWPAR